MQLRFPALSSLKNSYLYMVFADRIVGTYKKRGRQIIFLFSLLKFAGKYYCSLQVDSEDERL